MHAIILITILCTTSTTIEKIGFACFTFMMTQQNILLPIVYLCIQWYDAMSLSLSLDNCDNVNFFLSHTCRRILHQPVEYEIVLQMKMNVTKCFCICVNISLVRRQLIEIIWNLWMMRKFLLSLIPYGNTILAIDCCKKKISCFFVKDFFKKFIPYINYLLAR